MTTHLYISYGCMYNVSIFGYASFYIENANEPLRLKNRFIMHWIWLYFNDKCSCDSYSL